MFSLGTIETENLSALQNNKVSTFQGLCITINGMQSIPEQNVH